MCSGAPPAASHHRAHVLQRLAKLRHELALTSRSCASQPIIPATASTSPRAATPLL
jgi:hypothetical protein